eukprot:TRINITY_DN55105_c0_g1_i1.p1 TRINITY_DN55105_c0_g1~~TRINITY_DN55105_c0_g1_i1.p1  ORF type:complete len:286 (-),score=23.87 TRINITY_DN55105_c0_g1_i1:141-926(-)
MTLPPVLAALLLFMVLSALSQHDQMLMAQDVVDTRFVFKAMLTLVLALTYTCIARAFLPHDMVDGSPRYSWLMALPIQGIAIPISAGAAWYLSGLTVNEWLCASWKDLPDPNAQSFYLFLLCGYMAKDIPVGMDFQFAAHHVVCGLTAFYYLLADPSGLFIAGATILEFGSSSNTILLLLPCSLSLYLHVVIMTLSNIGAFLLGVYYVSMQNVSIVPRVLVAAVIVGLCLARQHVCHCNWQAGVKTRTLNGMQEPLKKAAD